MYVVTFNNAAGQLDSRIAQTPDQAAEVAIAMLREIGALYDGDSIAIESDGDDEPWLRC